MESKRPASTESDTTPDEKRKKCDDEIGLKTEGNIPFSLGNNDNQNIQGSSSAPETPIIIVEDYKERIEQEPERWQMSCRTIKDRMAKLYKSNNLADCTFLIGTTTVKEYRLHSFILSMASPVFEDLLSCDNKEIKIQDVESDAFDQILEYVYLDLLHLESVEKAQSLYRAAQKFKLTLIIERAVQLMMSNMSLDNIWPTMESAQITCDNILKAECLKVILINKINKLLASKFFNT
ncbi:kelch-like protein 40 [Nilaparvata lugens]|uniref:kelch-like protein 40 n=1 Tax=Nilaparvata lugens TaxID=108931 RepID=UPI00193D33CD|nr:kelch-like protein 40 [Nilaparvata lugens]